MLQHKRGWGFPHPLFILRGVFSLWYAGDWLSSYAAVLQFIGGVLSVLSDTLAAMIAEHIFAFFLAVLLLTAVVGLCSFIFHTARKGAQN